MGKESVGSDVEKVSSKVRNLRVERNEKQKSWVCLKKKRKIRSHWSLSIPL